MCKSNNDEEITCKEIEMQDKTYVNQNKTLRNKKVQESINQLISLNQDLRKQKRKLKRT